jgi:hypothetical protein
VQYHKDDVVEVLDPPTYAFARHNRGVV